MNTNECQQIFQRNPKNYCTTSNPALSSRGAGGGDSVIASAQHSLWHYFGAKWGHKSGSNGDVWSIYGRTKTSGDGKMEKKNDGGSKSNKRGKQTECQSAKLYFLIWLAMPMENGLCAYLMSWLENFNWLNFWHLVLIWPQIALNTVPINKIYQLTKLVMYHEKWQ